MTPQNQQQQNQIQSAGGEQVREQDKIMLVLAYLGCLSLIPLLTVKDSEFVQWNAKQGVVLNVGGGILMFVVGFVPFIGWAIGCLGSLALLIVDIMGIMKALKGERWRLPVVADLADKINL
jgi:uncharacterized membrane protein